MKWYKKQLDELKKKDNKLTSNPKSKAQRPPAVPDPVKLRNKNRPKTDSH